MRAFAALALSGRYAIPGRQAAGGLSAWARAFGVSLTIEDAGSSPKETARRYGRHLGGEIVLFGPYGSGPMVAVAEEMSRSAADDVIINHGGAVHPDTTARVISVIGPAERYWAGLADVLAGDGVALDRVVILHADTGFGRATAAGAISSLSVAGATPLLVRAFDVESAPTLADAAVAAGASAVVGCGRIEDDLAVGRALAGRDVAVGLVVCGVGLAQDVLGDAVQGWFGPAQWWEGGPPPPVALPRGADYPAAQALAAGLVAGEIVAAAGSLSPHAMWDAARGLRTTTFLGPFAVDEAGRQVAHAPSLVRWERRGTRLAREICWSPPAK
jgi:branched-chain amino acid transport system substrate-binding protein